ncbi:hypothetical protein M3Y99_01933300 [Aphelenchoides fujianensis]|nr:hypothetical protein M3Y99_01933300 [Aphelenchoides fujianensis]
MRAKPSDKSGAAGQPPNRAPPKQKRKLNTLFLGDTITPKPTTENADAARAPATNPFDSSRLRAQNANGNLEKLDVASCEFTAFDLREVVGTTKKISVKTAAVAPKLRVDFADAGLPTTRRVSSVEVENLESAGGQKVAKLTLRSAANHSVWSAHLPVTIVQLCANQHWTVASSAGGRMFVYATESGALQSSVRLHSPAVFSSLADHTCVVVDEKADILTWDLSRMERLSSQPLNTLILDSGTREGSPACAVTSNGIPIVFVDSGEVWFESRRSESWKQIETCANALSQLKSYMQAIKAVVPNGLLARIVVNDRKIAKGRRAGRVARLLAENPDVAKNYECVLSGPELVIDEHEDFAFI